MKNLRWLSLLLCFVLLFTQCSIFSAVFAEETEMNEEIMEESAEEITKENNTTEAEEKEDASSNVQVDEVEFNLSADYKTIKGENVRFFADGKFSFTYLKPNTYVKYLKHAEDVVEAEAIINGQLAKITIPTTSLVMAVTIVRLSNGEKELISELDPEYSAKIKKGKILIKAGEGNPLVNQEKFKQVNSLLKEFGNAGRYNASTGTTSNVSKSNISTKNNKNRITIKKSPSEDVAEDDEEAVENEEESDDATQGSSSKIQIKNVNGTKKTIGTKSSSGIGINIKKSSGSTSAVLRKVDSPLEATITKATSMYKNRNDEDEAILEISADEKVQVHYVGAGFSYIFYNETYGFVKTNDMKFEQDKGLITLFDKSGKVFLREEDNLKSKKIAELENGTVALVLEDLETFAKVYVNGHTGYVLHKSAKFINKADSLSYTATTKNSVNVRSEASRKGIIIDKLKNNTHLVVLETLDGWDIVELPDGKYAYIDTKFVK
ncbi:MAG: SH3 domain-containing protein [Eubacteriales bacterium]|nr:SH3 domain-containing protein [Eubacteriales bacterium]